MKEKFYHAKRHFVATALLLFATSPLWAQQTESKGYPYQKYEVTFAVGMPIEDASNFFGYPSTSLPNATPLDKYHWGKYYLKEENTSPIFWRIAHFAGCFFCIRCSIAQIAGWLYSEYSKSLYTFAMQSEA